MCGRRFSAFSQNFHRIASHFAFNGYLEETDWLRLVCLKNHIYKVEIHTMATNVSLSLGLSVCSMGIKTKIVVELKVEEDERQKKTEIHFSSIKLK